MKTLTFLLHARLNLESLENSVSFVADSAAEASLIDKPVEELRNNLRDALNSFFSSLTMSSFKGYLSSKEEKDIAECLSSLLDEMKLSEEVKNDFFDGVLHFLWQVSMCQMTTSASCMNFDFIFLSEDLKSLFYDIYGNVEFSSENSRNNFKGVSNGFNTANL